MSREAPREALATIEVRVWDLAQLFDALDPSPSSKRALQRGAESYILSRAGEHPAKTSLRLLIRGPETLRAQVGAIAEGIHEHFRSAHAKGERKFRGRMRIGGISLGVGLAVLGASMGLRSLLPDGDDSALAKGLGEGLLILGWVAMWRPVEILLFEHWESHLGHGLLARLARVPVEFSVLPDPALRSGAKAIERGDVLLQGAGR